MPLRMLMNGRRVGERPGLPVRPMDVRIVMLLVAASLAVTGVGLIVLAFMLAARRT